MANSIRDQLLQAGLITEEQVTKAESDKKNRNKNKNRRPVQNRNNPVKKNTLRNRVNNSVNNAVKKVKKKTPQSDLAKFYQQRSSQERKEKQEEEKLRQEAAKIKKERRQKVGKLIKENALQTLDLDGDKSEGEIRYNFVVGTSIKYIFVSEEQQQKLSEGELAITFLGGKKMLIPAEIGKQILDIDPKKIVAMAD